MGFAGSDACRVALFSPFYLGCFQTTSSGDADKFARRFSDIIARRRQIIKEVKTGEVLEYIATAANGWNAVKVGTQVGWVSGEYSRKK